ncbi:MAG: endonuclease/exonuclease/phosphatase family protein [Sphingobacteriales bacterium]|nr:MAG: endonuclease/exonuclease/phosphatase family protein [Sphingobacteriales bacterium]
MKFIKLFVSFFSRTLNIISVVFLFITLAASYISPAKIAIIPLLGYLFPVAVVLNVLFVFAWILRKRWFFWVSTLSLLLSYTQINNLITISKETSNNNGLKVMSYNVKNFDLYNWSENLVAQEKIFETIESENPDVICFQEFYSDTTLKFNTIKKLKQLGYTYYFFSKELVLRNTEEWGIATFSKFPIIDTQKILKQEHKSFYGKYPYKGICTTINYNKKHIQIINVHLQSVHFGKEDYKTITDIKEIEQVDESGAISLMNKLKKAFKRRATQADALKQILNTQQQEYILCGDFNDLPNSYTYNTISEDLEDVFTENGFGVGSTYSGNIPFLRIDYFLHTQGVNASDFNIIKNNISDHYPIVARFQL